MTVDESFGVRLECLRERVRVLEEGIRHLRARLAAWDRRALVVAAVVEA